MELYEFLNPPAIKQEKKKYSEFHITPIADIKAWREQQAAKEYTYRMRLGDRDKRLIAFESETNQSLDRPTITASNWREKLDKAMADRRELAESIKSAEKSEIKAVPIFIWQEKTLFDRFKGFCSRIWKSANF